MPKNKSAAIRYRIIDQCINDKRHKYPSLAFIAARCSEKLDSDISTSTIEKDLAVMKKDPPIGFSAPIVYSKTHKGYVYGEAGFSIADFQLEQEEWDALKFAAELLYQYKEVPVFEDFRQAIERINARFELQLNPEDKVFSELVHFEKANNKGGMEWLRDIYMALRNKYPIQFCYNNIYKKKSAAYSIHPYLLKEHRNRWYVVGWEESRQEYITFALDRITQLEVINNKRKKRTDFDADDFFRHATGIMQGKQKPVKVVLTIKHPLSRLKLLEPIHISQKILEETPDHIKITLRVLVNEEFLLRLLGFGPWCEVHLPLSLKEKMVDLIESMKQTYR